MAIFDALFEFSDGQSITSSVVADKVINWGQADLEMGAGEPLWLNVRVTADFDSAGTTLTIGLYHHTTAAVGSGTALWSTPAIAYGTLVAGYWIIRMPLPYNCDEAQFCGLYYTAASTFTTGNIDAWIDSGPQSSYDTQVSASNI